MEDKCYRCKKPNAEIVDKDVYVCTKCYFSGPYPDECYSCRGSIMNKDNDLIEIIGLNCCDFSDCSEKAFSFLRNIHDKVQENNVINRVNLYINTIDKKKQD